MLLTRILCDNEMVKDPDMLSYAENLCKFFIKKFKILYPSINVSYNVHSLLHIVADARRLGSVDSFSAFPYESFLGNIKTKIRSSTKPLSQLGRRISEGYEFKRKVKVQRGLLIKSCQLIPGKFKDSVVLLDDQSFARITDIQGSDVTVLKFKKIKTAYNQPFDTKFFNMFIVKSQNTSIVVKRDDVVSKCLIFPHNSNFLVMPLL